MEYAMKKTAVKTETEPAKLTQEEVLKRGLMSQKGILNYQKKCAMKERSELFAIKKYLII